jgi:spore germination protein KC
MEIRKWFLLTIITFLSLSIITGCWNYREIDQLLVVGGAAIDKGENGQYLITVETIQTEGGNETKILSKQFTMSGKTIFDAVRNEISITGKKLYWSHVKVVIISKEIAEEGILPFLDWFQRDSETRADINILVSNENTAKEILEVKHKPQEIKSLELEEMLKNQQSLSKAPVIEIWKVINDIESPGICAILPLVALKGSKPILKGTAIFNKDKLIGFLDSMESQNLLFVRDDIKGGLLVEGENEHHLPTPVTLEIFNSKTKIHPIIKNNDITFNINIELTLGLDEIAGDENYMEESKLKILKKQFEGMLNSRFENTIKQTQSKYGVDIFGLGAKIREEEPRKWKKIENTWGDVFKEVKVNVASKINIDGSGLLSEPLKVGD